ncbi:hypothetical protein ABW19_dt0207108 [Dactylella cylindrospora]|nr:hypothetical protein ABW19_dt0207108 [Dactylella cylindrospora]
MVSSHHLFAIGSSRLLSTKTQARNYWSLQWLACVCEGSFRDCEGWTPECISHALECPVKTTSYCTAVRVGVLAEPVSSEEFSFLLGLRLVHPPSSGAEQRTKCLRVGGSRITDPTGRIRWLEKQNINQKVR